MVNLKLRIMTAERVVEDNGGVINRMRCDAEVTPDVETGGIIMGRKTRRRVVMWEIVPVRNGSRRRDVFKPVFRLGWFCRWLWCIMRGMDTVGVYHYHPSGDVRESKADKRAFGLLSRRYPGLVSVIVGRNGEYRVY